MFDNTFQRTLYKNLFIFILSNAGVLKHDLLNIFATAAKKIMHHKMIIYFFVSASNGVVLATEKKQKSILYDEQSVHKVEPITKHIGMVYSGMGPDYRYVLCLSLDPYCLFFFPLNAYKTVS